MIEELESKYPISKICEKLDVSRAGYYKYLKNKGKKKKETKTVTELKGYITIIFHEHHQNYGYRKIHAELRDKYNLKVGEKIVRRLMHELGLKSQARKGGIKTDNLKSAFVRGINPNDFPNLSKRDFAIINENKSYGLVDLLDEDFTF